MPLPPNTRLGRYEIRSQLGAGGMGEVYLAQDTSELGRTVALKILPAEVAGDKDRLQRFTQEARTVSNLNHPNVLTVYEFGRTDFASFMATEYVDGVTLREHLSRRRLKLVDVLDVATQIVAALNAAHEAGITHRDLKPENVMVRRDQIVKVLDFGLAKTTAKATARQIDSEAGTKVLVQTEPGLVMGTVGYMSPEQSSGAATDQRTDVWSVGVVLYEMIAGCLPFQGKDIHRQIIAIQEAEPLPLSQQVEGVPERLEEIVAKCLAKNRDERYQTAKDLLIDLRNLRRKLDVEAEIERTVPPPFKATSGGASGGGTRVARTDVGATTASHAHPTSSAEYVVTGVKQHRLAAGLVVLTLVAGVIGFGLYLRAGTNVTAIESIAVMPFVNASGNAELDYLSDGMTETLIRSLSQLPNLNVKARSTVFRYKGKETDAKTIGRELGVPATLNGRMTQRGDQLTLNLELIDVQTENVIWTDQYDRKLSDLVSLQNEIARDVSSRLKLKLSGADAQKVAKTYTTDPEAYRLYLQGRFYWNKRGGSEFNKAEGYFRQAVEKDPNFALGYVGLADTNEDLDRPRKKDYIRRALELDDQLAEAHASLGYQYMLDYSWAESERELKRAMELNPNYAQAHQWEGARLMMLGRYDESLDAIKRALELDPTAAGINFYHAVLLFISGKTDESIGQFKKLSEMEPTLPWSHRWLSRIYWRTGDYAASVEERAKSLEIDGKPEDARLVRESFAKGGWNGFLKELLRQNFGQSGSLKAEILTQSGEKEEAMATLVSNAERGDFWLFLIKTEPHFDPLRGDPRFRELLNKFEPPSQ